MRDASSILLSPDLPLFLFHRPDELQKNRLDGDRKRRLTTMRAIAMKDPSLSPDETETVFGPRFLLT